MLQAIPGYDPFRLASGYHFDKRRARQVLDFFPRYLKHVKGAKAGQPFVLERWQNAFLANLFGWVKDSDGTRRYRKAFFYIPRKNGKTAICAGIANFLLFCDGEAGAEIYCAAKDRDQAHLLFSAAKGYVESNRELSDASVTYLRSIKLAPPSQSFVQVITSEAASKHGYNSHGILFDELHAQKDSELYDVLLTSVGARTQPLVVLISTADYLRESICNEQLAYAKKVRDGILDDATFLPLIYDVDPDADWQNPRVWRRANPNLGISLFNDYLKSACDEAKAVARRQNVFRRLHLNIVTESETRWLSDDAWMLGGGEVDESVLEGRSCWAGLDLASTKDFTALVLVFPFSDGTYYLKPFFWLPSERAMKRSQERMHDKFLDWSEKGFVELQDGDTIEYQPIRDQLEKLSERYDIREIAADPWNAQETLGELQKMGFEVVKFHQSRPNFTGPSKQFEKLVISGKMRHGDNPVLRWMASNVQIEGDSVGYVKPSKIASTGKIDGIVAAIMGLARAQLGQNARTIYDTRDPLIFG